MNLNKILKVILQSLVLVIFAILQIFVYVYMFKATKSEYFYLKLIYILLMIFTNIYILTKKDSAEYKMCWLFVVNIFPLIGLIIFFLVGDVNYKKETSKKIQEIRKKSDNIFKEEKKLLEKNIKDNNEIYINFKYIENTSGFPAYSNNELKYINNGKESFDNIFEDIENAKKYIFIEFFIMQDGKLLNKLIDILKKKKNEGVEVIILLDSFGSLMKLKNTFFDEMKKNGIKVYKFNKFNGSINSYLNYRNHRKTVIIDGKIAYTGGINLSDEYANIEEKYGYFKDYSIRIKGPCIKSFVVMFVRKLEKINEESLEYDKYIEKFDDFECNGYILPFEDGPDNRKNPIENTYIKTIITAKEYVYITTPYFSLENSSLNSILTAAISGVDVKIIFPKIPDKKIINIVTKSYYKVLLDAGVKIYEFNPGFIHSKLLVVDDDIAIVSNSNLDYRSFESNLEQCTYLYKTGEEVLIKKDFEDTLKDCKPIYIEDVEKRSFIYKLIEKIVCIFAPMF